VTAEFPASIGKVATRELTAHGVGPKAIRILGEELAAQGKAYAAD
jgi:hypothetical protein